MPLTLEDLQNSNHVIAIKEEEHRPMLLEQFPDWVDRVRFWHVHDIDVAHPKKALPELQNLVSDLIDEIVRAEFSSLEN